MNEKIDKTEFLDWMSKVYHESYLLLQQEFLLEKKFFDFSGVYEPTIDEDNFFKKLTPLWAAAIKCDFCKEAHQLGKLIVAATED